MKTKLSAGKTRHFRKLKAAGLAAVAGGAIALFGALPVHAAVLSVGPASGTEAPPFGGTICADVNGGSITSGTKVQAWECSAAPNQQYEFNGVTIYALGAQRCLDVYGAGTAAGTKVDSATCNGTAAQKWYYYDGEIINLNGDEYCLDATTGANGTQLVINPCSGAGSQNWQIK
jgi:hypothetical protein